MNTFKSTRFIVLISLLVLAIIGGGAYLYLDHQADVKAEQDRQAKIDRQHKANLERWQKDVAAWQKENDTYETTKADTEEAFEAADRLQGAVAGGLNYDEHTDLVGEFSSAINAVTRSDADPSVTLELLNAAQAYTKASEIWRDWYNDFDDLRELEDLPLERQWVRAEDAIFEAQLALEDLEPSSESVPAKPVRGKAYQPANDLVDDPDDGDGDPFTGPQS